ncbi:hypothetical protein Tco_1205406 [Tanacetum coccineum]
MLAIYNASHTLSKLRVLIELVGETRCLLASQPLFHGDVKNFVDVSGGVLGCRGLHLDFDLFLELLSLDQRAR